MKPFSMDRLSDYVAIGQYGKGKIDQNRFPDIGKKREFQKNRSLSPLQR